MAYEISSSIAASTVVTQDVNGSSTSAKLSEMVSFSVSSSLEYEISVFVKSSNVTMKCD